MCIVTIGAVGVAGIVRAAVGLTRCLVGIVTEQKARLLLLVEHAPARQRITLGGPERSSNVRLIDSLGVINAEI